MPSASQKKNLSAGRAHHATHTKGSWLGHLFRRCVHVAMAAIPILYYSYAAELGALLHLSTTFLLLIILAAIILFEGIRLWQGFILFGQRSYESKKISALAWGTFAVIVVLLAAPSAAFAIAIIWVLAFVDPFLGEFRSYFGRVWWVALLGVLFVLLIWWLCGYWFGISYWWGVLLAPLTVLVEWFELKWVDDNAVLALVPLAVVWLVLLIMGFA